MAGISLAEQILALSDPKPAASFHPDQEEFLVDDTAAKVCDFTYEEEGAGDEGEGEEQVVRGLRARQRQRRRLKGPALDLGEEDPRYAGRVVSRRQLEAEEGGERSAETRCLDF